MSTRHRSLRLMQAGFTTALLASLVIAAPAEGTGRINGSVTNSNVSASLCDVKVTLRGWTAYGSIRVKITGFDGVNQVPVPDEYTYTANETGLHKADLTLPSSSWGKPHIVNWTLTATDDAGEVSRTVLNRCSDATAAAAVARPEGFEPPTY